MQFYLEIEADENDGDCIKAHSEISEKDLARYMPLIEAIAERRGEHNWVTGEHSGDSPEKMYGDKFPKELIEEFGQYVPSGEFGVHSIDRILLLKVAEEVWLL